MDWAYERDLRRWICQGCSRQPPTHGRELAIHHGKQELGYWRYGAVKLGVKFNSMGRLEPIVVDSVSWLVLPNYLSERTIIHDLTVWVHILNVATSPHIVLEAHVRVYKTVWYITLERPWVNLIIAKRARFIVQYDMLEMIFDTRTASTPFKNHDACTNLK